MVSAICITEFVVVSKNNVIFRVCLKITNTEHNFSLNFSVFLKYISYFINLRFFFSLIDFIAGVIIGAVFINQESSSRHPQAYGRFQ